jgi:hypothetical protein
MLSMKILVIITLDLKNILRTCQVHNSHMGNLNSTPALNVVGRYATITTEPYLSMVHSVGPWSHREMGRDVFKVRLKLMFVIHLFRGANPWMREGGSEVQGADGSVCLLVLGRAYGRVEPRRAELRVMPAIAAACEIESRAYLGFDPSHQA